MLFAESIWASMISWLTPSILFLFLNLMIGTIAVTSALSTHKHDQQQKHQTPQDPQPQQLQHLPRSPSMLQRLKSINFYSYRSPEPSTRMFERNPEMETHYAFLAESGEVEQDPVSLNRSPSMLQRLKSAAVSAAGKNSEMETHYPFKSSSAAGINPEMETHYAFESSAAGKNSELETHYPFESSAAAGKNPEMETHYTFESSAAGENPEMETHYAYISDSGEEEQEPPSLIRSPSMLQRLKSAAAFFEKKPEMETQYASFSESGEAEQNPPPLNRSPSLLQRLKSSAATAATALLKTPETGTQTHDPEPSLDEIYSKLQSNSSHHVNRSKSDTKPAAGEVPKRLPAKMKKSASAKSAFAHFEEEEVLEARRPSTVREAKPKVAEPEDEEVDAKADDFINKFRNQLKLQRVDSILRYKEMIGRGSGK